MKEEELLNDGKRFHGHLGPYLALGLKAGLLAKERLKATPFKMKAELSLKLEKPVSCFIDGVQVASGCTMGKRNITAVDGTGISALFSTEGGSLRIKVKDGALAWINSLKVTKENEEEISREVMKKQYSELFEY